MLYPRVRTDLIADNIMCGAVAGQVAQAPTAAKTKPGAEHAEGFATTLHQVLRQAAGPLESANPSTSQGKPDGASGARQSAEPAKLEAGPPVGQKVADGAATEAAECEPPAAEGVSAALADVAKTGTKVGLKVPEAKVDLAHAPKAAGQERKAGKEQGTTLGTGTAADSVNASVAPASDAVQSVPAGQMPMPPALVIVQAGSDPLPAPTAGGIAKAQAGNARAPRAASTAKVDVEGKPGQVHAVGEKLESAVPAVPSNQMTSNQEGSKFRSGAGVEPVSGMAVAASVTHGAQGGGTVHAGKQISPSTAASPRVAAGADDVKTLAATPNVLEIGVGDGTHGWLKVRAQMGQAGEVAASLVTSSAGQAEQIRRDLPGLSRYLAAESVEVRSIVVHAAEASAGAQSATAGSANAGPGREAGGNSRSRDEQGGMAAGAGGREREVAGLDADRDWFSPGIAAGVLRSGSGNWLSVVA